MKESELYLKFIQRNVLFLLIPVILSIIVSIYFYAGVATKVQISQNFKINYNLENIDTMLALTDQAVADLRAQKFASLYPDSDVSIFKNAPLSINISASSLNRDASYALLLKEADYLRQNFSIKDLTSPEIILIEPNLLKYLLSGIIIGGLIGLVISLIREYMKNF